MLVGNVGVGKTKLLHKMAQNYLNTNLQVVHRFARIDNDIVKLDFYDTLGTEGRANSIIPQLHRGANLVFFVHRAGDDYSLQAIEAWRFVVQRSTQEFEEIVLGNAIGSDWKAGKGGEGEGIIVRNDEEVEDLLIKGVRACLENERFTYEEVQDQWDSKGKQRSKCW